MKLFMSFGFALKGLVMAIKDQMNLRVHLIAASGAIVLAFYCKITSIEWILLLFIIALVISLELINTAVEELTDLVTKEFNPLAGRVKDIAAAAVLFSSFIAVITGFIIFAKYIF